MNNARPAFESEMGAQLIEAFGCGWNQSGYEDGTYDNPGVELVHKTWLRQMPSPCMVGVGDGTGNLFVHGSYDAVKRVQAMVLELEELRRPKEQGTVIDLDAADWSAIQEAAAESKWIPPEYFRNDWVSDVCRFLRGDDPQPYDDVLLPFLSLMRAELHANAHKGDRPGWLTMDSKTAILEVFYHMGKLHQAVHRGEAACIKEYAADVANMYMMLVDVCGLLTDEET